MKEDLKILEEAKRQLKKLKYLSGSTKNHLLTNINIEIEFLKENIYTK